MLTRKRQAIFKISVVFFACLVFFLFCEGAARTWIFLESRRSFEEAMRDLPPADNGATVTLRGLIKPSLNPRIIYELRPDIDVVFYNGTTRSVVRTNKDGFRNDRNFSRGKARDTVRIVGIGDSFLFGYGVDQNKDTLSLLEKTLNERRPEKTWEIINASVPGYNTAMEIEAFEEKALRYDPDLVIVEYLFNDANLPNFIYEKGDWNDIKRFYFAEFLSRRFKAAQKWFRLQDSPYNRQFPGEFEGDLAGVPERYKDMVGPDACQSAFRQLARHKER